MISSLKDEITELKLENTEIKKSLKNTQIELAEAKLRPAAVNSVPTPEIGVDISDLSERVRVIEDFNRRNNLIVDGLPEAKQENSEILQKKLVSTFESKFEVSPDIVAVHRLGSRTDLSDGPRPIIVKFKDLEQRQICLHSAPKLKGTNLFLRDDVCQTTLDIRRSKLSELKSKRAQGWHSRND